MFWVVGEGAWGGENGGGPSDFARLDELLNAVGGLLWCGSMLRLWSACFLFLKKGVPVADPEEV